MIVVFYGFGEVRVALAAEDVTSFDKARERNGHIQRFPRHAHGPGCVSGIHFGQTLPRRTLFTRRRVCAFENPE